MIALPWFILLAFIFKGIIVLIIADIWLIRKIKALKQKIFLLKTNTYSLKESNRSIIITLATGLFVSSIFTTILKAPFKGFLPYGGNDGVSTGLFILISLFLLTVYLFKREKDLNNILKYEEKIAQVNEEEIDDYKRQFSNHHHWAKNWMIGMLKGFGLFIILIIISLILVTVSFKLYFFIMDTFL